MPTKLGLKPGSTLAVEDAIKGMVTRSANDAAVVVAEAIAGDEDAFAKLMTRKAQALGMSRTIYKNASGLPDSGQITTARDQSTLGRAVQERFPRYYKYFSIRTFVFRGQSIGNHNHLLGRVEGVDGIKTGYVNASGFNLVTSVHRGNRYLVAVVMGGSSAGSRDAKMRDLISDKIAQASVKRTAPMVAEGFVPPEAKPEPKAVAKIESNSRAEGGGQGRSQTGAEGGAKAEADQAEAKSEPKRGAVRRRQRRQPARALQFRAARRPNRRRPSRSCRRRSRNRSSIAGSTDPIRPVLVKTLSVKAGTQTASLAPMHVPPPAVEPRPAPAARRLTPAAPPAPVVAVKPEPPAPQPAPVVVQPSPSRHRAFRSAGGGEDRGAAPGAGDCKQAGGAGPVLCADCREGGAAGAQPVRAPQRRRPPARVAARQSPPLPRARARRRRSRSIAAAGSSRSAPIRENRRPRSVSPPRRARRPRCSPSAEAFTETVEKGGTTLYRARFAGLDKDSAEAACKYLKRNDVECVTIKN